MDYLRELQRRQSALLARLLTMESSREDSDETDATSQRLAAEQPLRLYIEKVPARSADRYYVPTNAMELHQSVTNY